MHLFCRIYKRKTSMFSHTPCPPLVLSSHTRSLAPATAHPKRSARRRPIPGGSWVFIATTKTQKGSKARPDLPFSEIEAPTDVGFKAPEVSFTAPTSTFPQPV